MALLSLQRQASAALHPTRLPVWVLYFVLVFKIFKYIFNQSELCGMLTHLYVFYLNVKALEFDVILHFKVFLTMERFLGMF